MGSKRHLTKRTQNGVKKSHATVRKVVRGCASQGVWGPLNKFIQRPKGDQLRHSLTPLRALGARWRISIYVRIEVGTFEGWDAARPRGPKIQKIGCGSQGRCWGPLRWSQDGLGPPTWSQLGPMLKPCSPLFWTYSGVLLAYQLKIAFKENFC